jgi:DNA repair exonuclease SbcCD ATPase subunit
LIQSHRTFEKKGVLKVAFEETKSEEPDFNQKERFICYAFNDIMLFTPEKPGKETFISKSFLIHFGFSKLIELLEDSYLNGNIFHLVSFTKNSSYSICCEAESLNEALQWVEIISENIEKKKSALLQSNNNENLDIRRSKLIESLEENCESLLKKEIECQNLEQKYSEIKESIDSNVKEISMLEEETKELIKKSPFISEKIGQIHTEIDELEKKTQEAAKEIESTDKNYWQYLARDFDVRIILLV